ncbi:hypothetical protein D3C74_483460 [compost metagenome]
MAANVHSPEKAEKRISERAKPILSVTGPRMSRASVKQRKKADSMPAAEAERQP